MASATEKAPYTKADFVAQWTPPEIHLGDIVLWYPDGDVNSTSPSAARVIKVGIRSVDLVLEGEFRQRHQHSVHYIRDPRMEENAEIRRYGGWDYSPATKQIHDLAARLKKLEDSLK